MPPSRPRAGARAAAALLLLPAAGPARAQAPSFPSGVELITVDVVVVDEEGRPVEGLAREDFVVKEDGRPQEIVQFEAWSREAEAPALAVPAVVSSNEDPDGGRGRAFTLLLDDLGLGRAEAAAAREASATFLRSSLRDGDLATLATTSGDVWWSARVPEGRPDLLAVLGRVEGRRQEDAALDRMSEYEAFHIQAWEAGPTRAEPPTAGPARSRDTLAALPADTPIGSSPGGARERVKKRWLELQLCTPSNCDGMVRGRAAEIDGRRRARTAAALGAVRRALLGLARFPGRKALVLVSPGFLQDREGALRGVLGASREANTAVYFVDARRLLALPGHKSAADAGGAPLPNEAAAMAVEELTLSSAGAQALAEETGGFSVRSANDLPARMHRIGVESRVFYLLGFPPPPGRKPGQWRRLEVEVRRPGVTVRARRGYALRAGEPAPEPPRRARGTPLGEEVARALDSPRDASGIPLRAMAYVFEPRGDDAVRVVVALELDASAARGPSPAARAARLEYSLLATHRDTGRVFRHDGALQARLSPGEGPAWRGLAREFDLPAGVAQVRAVVRDAEAGALGSVTHRFEVPPPGAFRLSTPIVTDRLAETERGVLPRPALAVHRVFPPGGLLYCQFEVFGARKDGGGPRVSARVRLRAADGRTVHEAPPTPIAAGENGRVVRMVGFPTEGLPEGAYELVVDVQDLNGGARDERIEPLTLARAAASR